ncbi:hypothetical protein HBA54_01025 [Pelagibius litoralis]|uniref:O-antigen ligase-related domain-containing protein n=1 Tax=Pelagibius litoralis TaxID=374515 RepID=A0A967C2X4_9PROT|nr:O-antigen ligase family protein [Pelagibius litoralis]NIA67170.1 hypothetical protein [Pelagibius litoralis]
MAHRDFQPDRGPTNFTQFRRFLTRVDVLTGILILVVCAAFVLETRWHRNLLYLLAVPAFLHSLWGANWHAVWAAPIFRLIVVYLAYFCLSAFWSVSFSWLGFADLLRVGLLSLMFVAIVVILATAQNEFEAKLFFWISVTAGLCLVALFAAALSGWMEPGNRLSGFGLASHPIIGATLYGITLLVCAFALIPSARGGCERFLWFTVIALCAIFMLMAGSRGPLLALGAALALGLAVNKTKSGVLVFAVLGVFGAALTIGLVVGVASIETTLTRGFSGHAQLWLQSLSAIAERPWFGYGALTDVMFESTNGTQRSSHNLYLANQFYGGLPASVLLTGLLGVSGLEAIRAARNGAPIYLILLTFGLTCAFFDTRSLVQNLGREWLTIWLPLALLAGRQIRAKHGQSGMATNPTV